MLNFSAFLLTEVVYDSLEGGKVDETERHRKQYYDDSTPESVFHVLGGRYLLDRDRTDLHPNYKKGEQIKLTSVAKMHDKNGVVRYHGITEHGHHIPMSHFKKPPIGRAGKNQQSLEEEQIKHLHEAIQAELKRTGKKFIRVRTADGQIHNVAGIKAPKNDGWPKADAYLHDEHGNPVHWMSLKGDNFQQWGGYRGLDEHPVMKKAIESFRNVKQKLAPESKYLPKASAYHYSLDKNNPEDRDLILKSMYGINHGREYGVNNVHAIYSGNTVRLRRSAHPSEKDLFELHPNALYVNRNNDKSDISDSKILLTNRAGLNQQGTGGRIMVSHSGNVKNSRDVRSVIGGEPMTSAQNVAAPKLKSISNKKDEIVQKLAPKMRKAKKPAVKKAPVKKAPPLSPVTTTLGRKYKPKAPKPKEYTLAGQNPASPMYAWKGSDDVNSGEHGGMKF